MECHACSTNDRPLELDALVVGAGWAGMWALHRLKQLHYRVMLIEANADVGGVWNYSLYPGCRNDTEVPLYEYSDPTLWQDWNWSERFPGQVEIQRYLVWVSHRLDIRQNMIFKTRIAKAQWDDRLEHWNIFTAAGQLATARFFIPCSGYTTIKYIPKFPGKETFPKQFHTSEWPADLDCTNKRVAVIGNAASGIQVIQALQPMVKKLVVLQRTPNLATPMVQQQYSKRQMSRMKRDFPRRFANRMSRNGYDIPPRDRCTFDDTPAERRRYYEKLWSYGGLAFWFSNYKDMLTNPKANAEAYRFWRSKVLRRIKSPDIAKVLAPSNAPHPFGTKRPSLESGYFELFNESNVALVDLKQDPIQEINSRGILTRSGTFHELDILVFATGFDFLVGSLLAMNIRGKHGRLLKDRWDVAKGASGVWTHLGLMTHGFPNMFFPMGPQAPSALGLTPQMSEVQGDWVVNMMTYMQENGKTVVEPGTLAEHAWKREVLRAAATSLMGKIESWYVGINIPGRKKEPLCYFGGVDKYIRVLEDCSRKHYPGFIMQ